MAGKITDPALLAQLEGSTPSVPAQAGDEMDLGVTEPVPPRPVTEPLKVVRAPGQPPEQAPEPTPGPVTDPALLAQLEGAPTIGEDPEVSDIKQTFAPESDNSTVRQFYRRGGPGGAEPFFSQLPRAEARHLPSGRPGDDPLLSPAGQYQAVQGAAAGDVLASVGLQREAAPLQDTLTKAAYLKWQSEHGTLTAEERAESAKLAAATGYAIGYVHENLAAIRKQVSGEDLERVAREHPVLADFLLDDTHRLHLTPDEAKDFSGWDAVIGKRVQRPGNNPLDPASTEEYVGPLWWHKIGRVFGPDVEEMARKTGEVFYAAFPPGEFRTVDEQQAAWDAEHPAGSVAGAVFLSPRQRYENLTRDVSNGINIDPRDRTWLAEIETANTLADLGKVQSAIAARRGIPEPPNPLGGSLLEQQVRLVDRLASLYPLTGKGERDENRAAIERLRTEVSAAYDYGEFSRTVLGQVVYAPIDMSRMLVGNVGATAVGGPLGAAAYNFAEMFPATAYDLQQAKDEKGQRVDPRTALALGALSSGIQAGLYSIPLSRFAGRILPGAAAAAGEATLGRQGVREILTRHLKEAGIEYATGTFAMAHAAGVGALIEGINKGKVDPAEIIDRSSDAMEKALVDMAGLSFAPSFVSVAKDLGLRRAAIKSQASIASALEQAKKTDQIIQRAPPDAQVLLQKMREAGGPHAELGPNLFADLERWNTYWTGKGKDPREIAGRVFGDSGAAYDKATSEKAERLAIPTEAFATRLASGELAADAAALAQDLATGSSTPTPRQMEESAKAQAKRAKEIRDAPLAKMDADHRAVYEDFKRQAMAAGEDEKSSDSSARLVSSSLRAWAEQFPGQTALDLWRWSPWNIEGPLANKVERMHLEDAFADYDAHPAGKAWNALSGEKPMDLGAGTDQKAAAGPEAGARRPSLKLDREKVEAILGKDPAKKIPTKKGGLDPDAIAKVVGAESGDKLLRDMLGMKDRTAWAKGQASARKSSGAEPRARRPIDTRLPEIERRLAEIMPARAARELAADCLRASPEKQADIYYRHPKSGLLNERAIWDAPADSERPLFAQVQIGGKKKANDLAGHDALDKLLRVAGREIHAAGADHVSQVGSDIMFRVKDQAAAQRIIDLAKAKLPGWVELSVGTGERKATLRETVDAINVTHGPVVESRRKGTPDEFPSFAERDDLPISFQAQGKDRGYRKALRDLADQGPLPEVSKGLRAKHATMDPRAAAEKAYRTEGGLLTAAGWVARRAQGKAKAHVASMDLRKIKRLNDVFGREVTDKILHEIEEMIRDVGGAEFDAAHLSGDEFAFQHDDKAILEKFRDRVRAAGREMSYKARKKSTGEVAVADGLELAVGIGKDWDHADGEALEADKAALDRDLGAGWEERRIRREADGGAGGGSDPGEPGGLGAAGGEAGREGGLERDGARPEAPGLAQDLAGLAPERIAEVRSLLSERDALTRRAAQESRLEQAKRAPRGIEAFRSMTREQFLGDPKIMKMSDAAKLVPRDIRPEDPNTVPFMGGKYRAKFADNASAVFDGDKVIASYNHGETLAVDRRYRKQGLAEELVYQWRTRFPGEARATGRNKVSQHIQEKVWDRIQRELSERRLKQEAAGSTDLGDGLTARLSDRDKSRGEIIITTPGEGGPVHLTIRILHGDKSTLAHESFHGLSVVLGELANRPDAPESIRRDYQKLLDVMGYKDHAERKAGMIDAKEEKASHLWEQYLLEGKAPIADLLTPFARFKTWLKRLYRGSEGIRDQYRKQYGEDLPALSDDVRELFGRMLAGDEAVADAAKETVGEMPAAPLTPEERRQSYELQDEARSAAEAALVRHLVGEERKTDKAFMKAERAKVKTEVRQDLEQNDPAVRAALALERGDLEGVPVKLDREALKELGPEVAAQVPKSMTEKGGADPHLVADLLGFDSPAELVRQVLAADVDGKVKVETTRRMAERYPRLEDRPALLRDLAKQKLASDALLRDGVLRMRAIAREAGLPVPKTDAAGIREAVEQAVREKGYSDLEVGRYEAAAKSFARRASELKDPQKRLDAFEAYLFNTQLAKAAREAREAIEQHTRHLQTFTTDAKRRDLGLATVEAPGPDGQPVVGQPYLSAMDSLLEAFELRAGATRKDVESRASQADALDRWAKERWADGDSIIIPESVLKNLKRQVFWKDLSLAEMEDLRNAADSIAQQAKLRTIYEAGGQKMDREKVIQALVADALANGANVKQRLTGEPTLGEKTAENIRYALGGIRRPEVLFELLGDSWRKLIFDPISDASYRFHDLARESNQRIQKRLRDMPASERARMRERHTTEDGVEFTIEEAIGALLNSGTESNLSKMLRGMSDFEVFKTHGAMTWNGRGTLDKILRHLTQRDVDLVNEIHKTLEARWDAMSDLEKKDSGLAPMKVQPKPFKFIGADGAQLQIDGGYYPLIANRAFKVGKGQAAADAAQQNGMPGLFFAGYERALTPQGHLRERVEAAAYPLDLHLDALPRHLVKESKDLAFRMPAKQAYRVLTDRRIVGALHRALGKRGYDTVIKWLQDSVNDIMLPSDSSEWANDQIRRLRSATYKSTFALNIPQTLQNFADAAGIGEIVPEARFAKAALRFARDVDSLKDAWIRGEDARPSLLNEIAAKSPEMRLRLEGIKGGSLMADLESTFRRSQIGLAWEKVQDLMIRPFEVTQIMTEAPAWLASYEHALDPATKGGLGLSESDAVRHADDMVRRMFGDRRTVGLTPIQRAQTLKHFTMFWGWSAAQLNKYMRSGEIAKRQWTEGMKLKALRTITANFTRLWGVALASALLTGKGPADDDEDGKASAGEIGGWAWHEGWTFPLTSLPMVGSAIRGALGDQPTRDVSLTAWTRPLDAIMKTVKASQEALSDDAGDDAAIDAFLAWMAAGGQLVGAPVSSLRRAGRYWMGDDRTGQESILRDIKGTAFGPERN